MNRNKLYECQECGTFVKIRSKGKCNFCRSKEREKPSRKPIKKNVDKKVIKKKQDYTDFFNEMLETLSPLSVESGKHNYYFTRANICHIFPKRNYKSVAINPLNVIVLTVEEHSLFDYYLDTRDTEKLLNEFPKTVLIIKERLEELLTYIHESGSFKEFIIDLCNNLNK